MFIAFSIHDALRHELSWTRRPRCRNTGLGRRALLPSSPFTKALHYIRERRDGLADYLDDSGVPIYTNTSNGRFG
jgi:hypothetical protein